MQIAVASAGVPSAALLRRWARLALAAPAALTLRVVGAAEARRLNREFRGRDYATNVLSFDYLDRPARSARGAERCAACGDIVLCHSVIAREAREQAKPLSEHYAHLVVHGVLHLLGMDHQRAAARKRMEQHEIALLAGIGIANPYLARVTVQSRRTLMRQ